MVKHIVMFKLKDSLSQDEKNRVMNDFKKAIEALPEIIPFIRQISVNFNINSSEKWDICLESEFDKLNDVRDYSVHPAHLAAGAILKDAKEERACVDYEF